MSTVTITVRADGTRDTARSLEEIAAAVDEARGAFRAADDATRAMEDDLRALSDTADGAREDVRGLAGAFSKLDGDMNGLHAAQLQVTEAVEQGSGAMKKFLLFLGGVAVHAAIWEILVIGAKKYGTTILAIAEVGLRTFGAMAKQALQTAHVWTQLVSIARTVAEALQGTFVARAGAAGGAASRELHRFVELLHEAKSIAGLTNGKLKELAGNLGEVRMGFNRAWSGGKSFLGFLRQLLPVLAYLGTLLVTGLVAKGLVSFAAKGAQILPVKDAFDQLAVSVKSTSDVLLRDLQQATKRAVSEVDLMKNAVLALNSGAIKNRTHLTELAGAAQILGQTVGLNTAEAFQNLIRGIGLVNPQLIKSVGVLVSAETAYRKYADSVKKSVSELTDEERHEAFRIEVMTKLAEATDRVRQKEDDLNLALQQAGAAGTDFVNTMRLSVAGSQQLTATVNELKVILGGLAYLMKGGMGDALRGLTDGFFTLVRVMERLTPLLNFFVIVGEWAGEEAATIDALAQSWHNLGAARAAGVNPAYMARVAIAQKQLDSLLDNTPSLLQRLFRPMEAEVWKAFVAQGRKNLEEASAALARATAEEVGRAQPLTAGGILATLPADLRIGSENLRAYSESAASAKEQISNLTLQLSLLKIQIRQTTDPAQLEELNNQAVQLAQNLMLAQRAVDLYGSKAAASLAIATQEAGIWDTQFRAAMENWDVAGDAGLSLTEGLVDTTLDYLGGLDATVITWDNIILRMQNAREEMDRLNEGVRKGMQAPATALQNLQAMQQANISPFMAGFTVEGGGGGFAKGLMEFARLQQLQQQWGDVLSGDAEALQRLNDLGFITADQMKYLAQALQETDSAARMAAGQLITTLGGAFQAMILGTEHLGSVMISTATQLIQASLARTNPFAATVVGAVGGVIGALFRKKETQKVELDRYSTLALDQQKSLQQQIGPSQVTLQFVDPRSGEITSEVRSQLLRMERRDAVERIPRSYG